MTPLFFVSISIRVGSMEEQKILFLFEFFKKDNLDTGTLQL